jgi:hypothetical protein
MREAIMKSTPWQDRLILVAGIWLLVSPFVVGTAEFSHPATVTALVAGAMLVSSAAEAPIIPDVFEEWVDITVAIALAASPWLLDYASYRESTLNAVATGSLVGICAVIGLLRAHRSRAAADEHPYPAP